MSILPVVTLALAVGFFGCAEKTKSPLITNATDPEAAFPTETPLWVDAAVPSDTVTLTKSDLSKVKKIQTAPAAEPSALHESQRFAAVFGSGPNALSDGTLQFLNLRVKRLLNKDMATDATLQQSKAWPYTVAWNYGASMFLAAVKNRDSTAAISLEDGSLTSVTTPRSGLIQLGPYYEKVRSSVSRLSYLIHEARHSDCSVRTDEAGLRALVSADADDRATQECGYLHVKCGDNFVTPHLRNQYACEAVNWGSYAIEAVWLREMHLKCENCDDEVKENARISALDRASRAEGRDLYQGRPKLWSVVDIDGRIEDAKERP